MYIKEECTILESFYGLLKLLDIMSFFYSSLLNTLYPGTCDNCTSSKKEIDMSREAFLLMACIQSCGGHWGLNLPVDVLRGSRVSFCADKIQIDKLMLQAFRS